ncbi:MAG TPA: addiction module protein [Planctomycetaceae bacterium]|nr:addiction module protein [Planctomycetaceae bacterium]
MMTLEQLRTACLALPKSDRLSLMDDLWQSVESPETPVLSRAQIAELDRRLDDFQEHPQDMLTWDEFLARRQARS